MSPVTTYASRKGEIPCGDKDLFTFLTDMRNMGTVVPDTYISEWEATEDACSFKVDKAGKVSVALFEGLPHSRITYNAESLLTGKVAVTVEIEHITDMRSAITITAGLNMNPILKMFVGDAAGRYLDVLIGAIESYEGFDKIRGCNQSL